MSADIATNLRVEKLSDAHSNELVQFKNQEKDLVEFLAEDALSNHRLRISQTYLFFLDEPKTLVGYVTLLSDSIRIEENEMLRGYFNSKGVHYKSLPALKIGRMATSEKYQKKGVGSTMIYFSIEMANRISGIAGCRFVTVDAKQAAMGFYNRLGFKKLKEGETVAMYLDLFLGSEVA